jgi:hypothetical protein
MEKIRHAPTPAQKRVYALLATKIPIIIITTAESTFDI